MAINRESAMRLWNEQFGRRIKARDFAGREIAKSAYNDRNSNFGWNVDHIRPLSHGGENSKFNLVCCSILTNEEKADGFPKFRANGHMFEVVMVEKQYEIVDLGRRVNPKELFTFD